MFLALRAELTYILGFFPFVIKLNPVHDEKC